jgi:transposase InsO family protein
MGFIETTRERLPVRTACHLLGVSPSHYYASRRAAPSARASADVALTNVIRRIHTAHQGRYGTPRVHRELHSQGLRVSRKRVRRLRLAAGLIWKQRRRFRRTTDSRHTKRIAANLLGRNFTVDAVNQAWVGDVTYVPTISGWLFLAVLIDLKSRRVVGWAVSTTLDTNLVLAALRKALALRGSVRGCIHHTDRDSRYAADDYLDAMKQAGLTPSMSRKADCWDNAVAESFFATLEKELLARQPLLSVAATAARLAEYIDGYYNVLRRHSTGM